MSTPNDTDETESHERVRWARIRWQERNGMPLEMETAALRLGMKPHTYRAYEREPGKSKHIELDYRRARLFGKVFGVSWQWLLTGEGDPDQREISELGWRASMILEGMPEERQREVVEAMKKLFKQA